MAVQQLQRLINHRDVHDLSSHAIWTHFTFFMIGREVTSYTRGPQFHWQYLKKRLPKKWHNVITVWNSDAVAELQVLAVRGADPEWWCHDLNDLGMTEAEDHQNEEKVEEQKNKIFSHYIFWKLKF